MTDSVKDLNVFYADVDLFIRRLRVAGMEQLSQSLEVAMAGSTSGEILTNIAYLLDRARMEEPYLPENLAGQRDAILGWADAALRAVGQHYRPRR